jgi:hypothetical protein
MAENQQTADVQRLPDGSYDRSNMEEPQGLVPLQIRGGIVIQVPRDILENEELLRAFVAQERKRLDIPRPDAPKVKKSNPTWLDSTSGSFPNRTLARGAELAGAFNRNIAGLADIATSPIQLPVEMIRQGDLTPQGGDFIRRQLPERGAFAGDDFWGNVAAGAGDMGAFMIPTGAGLRLTANAFTAIPKLNPSALHVFLRDLGKTTAKQDVIMGLQSGAGGEILGQLAEGTGVEPLARATGLMLTPLVFNAAANTLLSVGKNYISTRVPHLVSRLSQKFIPSVDQLKGLATAQYNLLEAKGFKMDGPSTGKFIEELQTFATNNGIDAVTGTGPLASRINQLINAANESRVTWSFLDKVRGELLTLGKAGDTTAGMAKNLAEQLDSQILKATFTSPEGLKGFNAAPVITQARQLHRRRKNVELMDDIVRNAEVEMLKTDGNTAANYAKQIRDQMAELLKPGNIKGQYLTRGDKKLINEALRRGGIEPTLNALQGIGFNSNDFVKIMLLGTVAQAAGFGVPAGMAGAQQLGIMGTGVVGLTSLAKAAEVAAAGVMRQNAALSRSMLAAGENGPDIIRGYFRNTTMGNRKPEDLAALIINNRANPDEILRNTPFGRMPLVRDALALATGAKTIIGEEEAAAEEQSRRDANLVPPD